jgi:hypothetical protein
VSDDVWSDALDLLLDAFPGSKLLDSEEVRVATARDDPNVALAAPVATRSTPISAKPRRVHRRAGTAPPANRAAPGSVLALPPSSGVGLVAQGRPGSDPSALPNREGGQVNNDLEPRDSGLVPELLELAEQARSLKHKLLEDALAFGDVLLKAKKVVGHGSFLPFLAEIDTGEDMAECFMRVASHKLFRDSALARILPAAVTTLDVLIPLTKRQLTKACTDNPGMTRDRARTVVRELLHPPEPPPEPREVKINVEYVKPPEPKSPTINLAETRQKFAENQEAWREARTRPPFVLQSARSRESAGDTQVVTFDDQPSSTPASPGEVIEALARTLLDHLTGYENGYIPAEAWAALMEVADRIAVLGASRGDW